MLLILNRIESTIVEELKEKGLNVINLLQTQADTCKRSRINKDALQELQKLGIDSIESMKGTIDRAHNKDIKELAERSLQHLEELQKFIDESLNEYKD